MGIVLAAAVLAAAPLRLALVRRGRLQSAPSARPAKAAALMLAGLGVGFFLPFAIAEPAGGDVAGLPIPLVAVPTGVLFLRAVRSARRHAPPV